MVTSHAAAEWDGIVGKFLWPRNKRHTYGQVAHCTGSAAQQMPQPLRAVAQRDHDPTRDAGAQRLGERPFAPAVASATGADWRDPRIPDRIAEEAHDQCSGRAAREVGLDPKRPSARRVVSRRQCGWRECARVAASPELPGKSTVVRPTVSRRRALAAAYAFSRLGFPSRGICLRSALVHLASS